MTGMIANFLLNILIVALLSVTIAYCWVLNRRIRILQDSKGELAQLLQHFDESTQRAAESIIALQNASKKIGENIQLRIDKANYVLDDLAFLIEKGNKLNDQLEAGFAVQKAKSRAVAPEPDYLEEAQQQRPSLPHAKTHPHKHEKTAASLEAVLERVMSRTKPPQGEEDDEQPTPRSRSEQELLAMIRSGMKG